MAVEKQTKAYYYEDAKSFIDIHDSAKVCLEQYLSKVLFFDDPTRIIYSMPDFVFRRRTDLLDQKKLETLDLSPISLQLPFGAYYQSSDWENDDRPAATQTGQILLGQYSQELRRYVRSRAVMASFKVMLFFSRRDDVRQAVQKLNWEANPKGPARLYTGRSWRGNMIGIPVFVTIEKVDSKPEWKSTDWLEKQKIYPVEIECKVRSYELLINKSNKVISLPVRFSPTYDDSWSESNDNIYITNEVDLDFFCEKFNWKKNIDNVDFSNEDIQANIRRICSPSTVITDEEAKNAVMKLPSTDTRDIIRGYFSETEEVTFNHLEFNKAKSKIIKHGDINNTEVVAWLDINIKKADRKFFDYCTVLVPGHENVTFDDCDADHLEIQGLYPRSTYECTFIMYSTNGTTNIVRYTFTTPDILEEIDETSNVYIKEESRKSVNPAPTPKKINSYNPLVGRHI